MRLKIAHTSRYHYDQPVHYALQQLRLTPKSRAGQTVISWKTDIDGGVSQLQFDDQHNNHVELISFNAGQTDITVRCEGEVENLNGSGIVGTHGGYTPLWLFLRATPLTRAGNNVRKLAKSVGTDFDGDEVARLHALSSAILETVGYQLGTTVAGTTAEEAIETGSGVCQDHAQIFVAAARAMGIPARYVSGYLMMNDRVEQDATHAWAEAHVDSIGWIGFDISNGISPDERYVRVATGLDFAEAAPVSGLRLGHSAEKMDFSLQVQQ